MLDKKITFSFINIETTKTINKPYYSVIYI